MRSLVTGSSGFVGAHLVDALVARGDEVTSMDVTAEAPRPDVTHVRVDVRDRAAVMDAIAGHDVVFHNASVVHTRKTLRDDVFAINLGGSRHVRDACAEHGVTRLVYVSSASAVYEGRDIENGDERMPYSVISQAPYADSKIAAERELLDRSGEDGVRTCAIRPHVIFGPGDGRFLPAILSRAKAGRLKLGVGKGDKLSDFTYVGNLVDALLAADDRLAADADGVAGEAFFVTNGEPRPFWDFVQQILRELDLPPIRGMVPYPIAYSVAAVKETLDAIRGIPLGTADGMSRFAIRYMCTHHYFDIGKARERLGWTPRVDLDEGIRRTAAALRAEGAV